MTKKSKLKIIPLGGLGEVGKNITVFEYGEDIVVLDCGMSFPDDEMLGVDLVIPDISYLEKNASKIRGIVLTHGHEDHIGALAYVLKKINIPIYATRLTLGLIEGKLKEHNIDSQVKKHCIKPGNTLNLGCFKLEFIKTNHSIADCIAVAFYTPVGVVVHTGDFKIDTTPIDGEMIDLTRFGELGKKGVLALLSDSTNAERPGLSMSEKTVGERFEEIFKFNDKRILVASFASNVHRVQQIINTAYKFGRKVAVSGRSMENIVEVATQLGYMNLPKDTLISIDEINKYRPNQIVIITTGSQGEPMSALSRMAFSDHRKVELTANDLIILSSTPIPGNEKTVSRVVNELIRRGCTVIYESLAEVHVSGHACREELKIMLALVKPKIFIPVHGEYRHLQHHSELAQKVGIRRENIFIMQNGKVLELDSKNAKINGTVPSGKVLIDGLGVGDVGNIVLRDRKHLAQDGLIVTIVTISSDNGDILAGPDIISRGFVYVRESEELMETAKGLASTALEKCISKGNADWASLKSAVKRSLSDYFYQKTKRNPMILPVIVEV